MKMHRRAFVEHLAEWTCWLGMAGCMGRRDGPVGSEQLDELAVRLGSRGSEPLALFWQASTIRCHEPQWQRRRSALLRFMNLSIPNSFYNRLHWFRFFGPFARSVRNWFPDAIDGLAEPMKWRETLAKVIDELSSSKSFHDSYHEVIHVPTRYGIGFVTADGQAARNSSIADPHPNKILSLFALAGLTLDHKIQVNGTDFAIRDCVVDAARNCDLRRELPWTAVALSHYLPPISSWRDKTDALISFDDIVARMCELPLGQGACFGHHLLFALATLRRAARHVELLSRKSLEAIESQLRRGVEFLQRTQSADGSWPANWTGANPYPDGESLRGRLISTSHALEWISCLPPEQETFESLIERAEAWLCQRIDDLNEFELTRNYSAISHAAFGFICLSERV